MARGLTRRDFLSSTGAAAGFLFLPSGASSIEDGLNAHAKRRGLTFGCAVRDTQLVDQPLRDAMLREVGMMVPENEMKWRQIQKTSERPNYFIADRMANFAANHQLKLRGHTIIWHQNPPMWARQTLAGADGQALLLNYTRDIVSHFRGRVVEWDVVNEAIELKDKLPGGLRDWHPYQENGYDFIANCFRVAHETDPNAVLCYNDFGLEYDNQSAKREAVLLLLRELKKRDAPIHCLGIQSHLVAGWNFNRTVFRTFLDQVAKIGLKIRLTELEVDDKNLSADIAERDAGVAKAAHDYLTTAFEEPAVTGVLSWGLSDYTTRDVQMWRSRKDRLKPRRLLLDENFGRKPVWYAVADCFDNAALR
jgi:endo-1,4-beta-xylanase